MLTNNLIAKLNQFYSYAQSLDVEDLTDEKPISWDLEDFTYEIQTILKKQVSVDEVNNWLKINNLNLNTLGDYNKTYFQNIIYHFHEKDDINVISLLNKNELEQLLSNENKNYYFIPDDTNDHYSFKFVHETLLTKTDVIPQFYFYNISVKKAGGSYSNFDLDKELAHYHFIFQALSALRRLPSVEEGIEFINDNKEKIDKLLKSIKYNRPKFLGKGADGVAFDIGNQQILKLFKSHNAYIKAMEAMVRSHSGLLSAKTEPMMYDVGILGEIGYDTIYYYIIEKMNTIPSDMKSDISYLISRLETYSSLIIRDIPELKIIKHQIDDGTPIDVFDKELSQLMPKIISLMEQKYFKEDLYNKILKINNYYSLHRNWIELLIEEFVIKALTGRNDLQSGNIGITNNGQLRFFDPVS